MIKIQYDPALTIGALKTKLYGIVGTSPEHQRLQLYDQYNALIADLPDDSRTLESYGVLNHMRIHVVDVDPMNKMGAFADAGAVEKFTISEEEYDKREDTFRKWKARNIPQKEAPEGEKVEEKYDETTVANIKVGNRFETLDDVKSRGEVKYVGKTVLGGGQWVGVQYDEPLGKHNGTVKTHKYFECPQNHGSFLRPDKLQVGDFPERDLFDEDEI